MKMLLLVVLVAGCKIEPAIVWLRQADGSCVRVDSSRAPEAKDRMIPNLVCPAAEAP